MVPVWLAASLGAQSQSPVLICLTTNFSDAEKTLQPHALTIFIRESVFGSGFTYQLASSFFLDIGTLVPPVFSDS